MDTFTRSELRAIESKALTFMEISVNEGWKDAYKRLATAANILDAFMGRSQICANCFPFSPPADCTPDQVHGSVPSHAE